ncbi:unnamed protein product [Sphagnum jensenii]|uniref:Beta-galactosidase n=1 Tax=Sphagnum jensenii TaxID=128206 RepID=A0ABP1BT65_9BRYO
MMMMMMVVVKMIFSYDAGKPFNVSFDHRALIIDGSRRMLISAGIHYPRAAPEMWPDILAKAKEGGADVVQTYVFWDGHEPQPGMYNFNGRYDLPKFVKLVAEAGMYLHLRIGPYVCAEWNFGGFPVWLRDVPGIVFRTDNQPFKEKMEGFVRKIVNLMKANELFAWQGGPIILAQIENEYGNVEWEFGDGGRRYVQWAANMALGLNAGVPWVMCQQNDAPSNIINTCNGYYCDGWKPKFPNKPVFWTEDWNGWFQDYGHAMPHRPVEDNAFAVARFFQRGGSFQNYYMYFGGTNFARTSGGPFITTSYDYDAPIDEYGLIRQPKWGHLKELHAAIKLCEPALTAIQGDPTYIWLGSQQEAHVYSANGHCAAFLANIDNRRKVTVHFRGQSYLLPPWSVSILPDCKKVIFNTAQYLLSRAIPDAHDQSDGESLGTGWAWESYMEYVGVRGNGTVVTNSLLEQISTTKDSTDYLWYTTSVTISEDDIQALSNTGSTTSLILTSMRDAVHVFINGKLAGSAMGWNVQVDQKISLQAGSNSIALLSMTVGLQNYGAYLETWGAGIQGSVLIRGLPSGDLDLTSHTWVYQVGLEGEHLKIFSSGFTDSVMWTASPITSPLVWHKTTFDAPAGEEPVALDLGSMGKGQAWVNGEHIGRFWPSMRAPQWGCSQCDYRGAYNPDKCLTNCGEPSQRWHHIPRAWLQPKGNLLVVFEEVGGDPLPISVVTRSQDVVCGHVSELHPPPFDETWISNHNSTSTTPTLQLACTAGHYIIDINFSSYGNPDGSCGDFKKGACHAVDSFAAVHKACVGKQQCTVAVAWFTFGGSDPCPTTHKSLAVQAQCSSVHGEVAQMEEMPVVFSNYTWQKPGNWSHHNQLSTWQRKPPVSSQYPMY